MAVFNPRCHCNSCHRETNHETVAEHDWAYTDVVLGEMTETFMIIQCCGCDTLSVMRLVALKSVGHFVEEQYPPRISRKQPEWIFSLEDKNLEEVLIESYKALSSDSPRLAAMGARAALEQVMIRCVGEHGNFNNNIQAFVSKGYLPPVMRDSLMKILDVGSAAIHRGYVPTASDLNVVFDVLEGVIASVHVLPKTAKGLAPPAKPKKLK